MLSGDVSGDGEWLRDELAVDLKEGHLAEGSLCKEKDQRLYYKLQILDFKRVATTRFVKNQTIGLWLSLFLRSGLVQRRKEIKDQLTLLEFGPLLKLDANILELDLGQSQSLTSELELRSDDVMFDR